MLALPPRGTEPVMTATLDFWFEFASTYSYPAVMTLEADAAQAGVTVHWHAILLGPIFQAQGYASSPFLQFPNKGRYMWRDMERLCAKLELPYRQPTTFPRTSVAAARIVAAYPQAPWIPAFVRAIYTANFAEDRDISQSDVVTAALLLAGVADPLAVFSAAQTAPLKDALRSANDRALALGLFGAPSYSVGNELFWGNERQADALAWARCTTADT